MTEKKYTRKHRGRKLDYISRKQNLKGGSPNPTAAASTAASTVATAAAAVEASVAEEPAAEAPASQVLDDCGSESKSDDFDHPSKVIEFFEDPKHFYQFIYGIGAILEFKESEMKKNIVSIEREIVKLNEEYAKNENNYAVMIEESQKDSSSDMKDSLQSSVREQLNKAYEAKFSEKLIKKQAYDVVLKSIENRRWYIVKQLQSANPGKEIKDKIIKAAKDIYKLYRGPRYIGIRTNLFKQIKTIATNPALFRGSFFLNASIVGPAGSGKTLMSRQIAKWYAVLGILTYDAFYEDDRFKLSLDEVSRAGLIGEYTGQTAPKVLGVLAKSLEKTLFIDEAYSVTGCSFDSDGKVQPDAYGEEFLATLLLFMNDHKGYSSIIVAGYESQMKKCFFDRNEGLPRRFPNQIVLPFYSTDELFGIFVKNVIEKLSIPLKEREEDSKELLLNQTKKYESAVKETVPLLAKKQELLGAKTAQEAKLNEAIRNYEAKNSELITTTEANDSETAEYERLVEDLKSKLSEFATLEAECAEKTSTIFQLEDDATAKTAIVETKRTANAAKLEKINETLATRHELGVKAGANGPGYIFNFLIEYFSPILKDLRTKRQELYAIWNKTKEYGKTQSWLKSITTKEVFSTPNIPILEAESQEEYNKYAILPEAKPTFYDRPFLESFTSEEDYNGQLILINKLLNTINSLILKYEENSEIWLKRQVPTSAKYSKQINTYFIEVEAYYETIQFTNSEINTLTSQITTIEADIATAYELSKSCLDGKKQKQAYIQGLYDSVKVLELSLAQNTQDIRDLEQELQRLEVEKGRASDSFNTAAAEYASFEKAILEKEKSLKTQQAALNSTEITYFTDKYNYEFSYFEKLRYITVMKPSFLIIHCDTTFSAKELLRRYLISTQFRISLLAAPEQYETNIHRLNKGTISGDGREPISLNNIFSYNILAHVLMNLFDTDTNSVRKSLMRRLFYKNVFNFQSTNLSYFAAQAGEMENLADLCISAIGQKMKERTDTNVTVGLCDEAEIMNAFLLKHKVKMVYYKKGDDDKFFTELIRLNTEIGENQKRIADFLELDTLYTNGIPSLRDLYDSLFIETSLTRLTTHMMNLYLKYVSSDYFTSLNSLIDIEFPIHVSRKNLEKEIDQLKYINEYKVYQTAFNTEVKTTDIEELNELKKMYTELKSDKAFAQTIADSEAQKAKVMSEATRVEDRSSYNLLNISLMDLREDDIKIRLGDVLFEDFASALDIFEDSKCESKAVLPGSASPLDKTHDNKPIIKIADLESYFAKTTDLFNIDFVAVIEPRLYPHTRISTDKTTYEEVCREITDASITTYGKIRSNLNRKNLKDSTHLFGDFAPEINANDKTLEEFIASIEAKIPVVNGAQ